MTVNGLILALQEFREDEGEMEVMVYVPGACGFRPVLGDRPILSQNGGDQVCVLRVPEE